MNDCPNLLPESIYQFIKGDFTSLWDSLALNKNPSNGGNFTFALLDMILLEFVARYCSADKSGKAITDFSSKLNEIEPKYFTEIPNFSASKTIKKLRLPSLNGNYNELIHLLFDLIRNGQAHHYQQIIADLNDTRLVITISGRVTVPNRLEGLLLSEAKEYNFRNEHLGLNHSKDCTFISFRPEVFFLDITRATESSEILKRGFKFSHVTAGSKYSSLFSKDLSSALRRPELAKILKGKKNISQRDTAKDNKKEV